MIQLRKHGEEEPKQLPKGVKLLLLGDKAVFVKKTSLGKLFPLPENEQERLKEIYCDRPPNS